MKTEILYAIILAAVVIIAWVAGSYFVNRSEKRNQQRKTRVILRDEYDSEDYRNHKVVEGIRKSAEYDEANNEEANANWRRNNL